MAPGRTGFVVDTVDEMVEAVKRIDVIDRAACRRWVEQHFSVERMVDRYETVYRYVLASSRVALTCDGASSTRRARPRASGVRVTSRFA
jgi:hypothetical protein